MLKSMRNCLQVFLLDWRTDKANNNFKKINRMKKFITLMILSALCLGAKAQQINGDFSTWEDCKPWTGNPLTTDGRETSVGTQPKGWQASNVWGYGEDATGKNSNFVVQNGNSAVISNVFVGAVGIGAWAPGYLSLGTPWNTALVSGFGNRTKTDGGSFGGKEFTNKPDAISFVYSWNRYGGTASFIGLLWKGTWTQNNVPTNVVFNFFSTPKDSQRNHVDMIDRDANILGKTTSQGDGVSKSSDALLIASYEEYLTESGGGTKIIEFDYKDKNATPEKINIIFASNDYFSQTVAGKSGASVDDKCNSLTISDVKLIYYHSLSSCTYDGQPVSFDDNNSASVSALYDESKLAYVQKGVGAKVEKAYDNATGVLTITVKGNDYDADNTSVTTYTIQFATASATLAVNSAAQYGTFCAPFNVTIPAGVTAYTISGIAENGKLTLAEQQNTIPAHTPVIVYSESTTNINEVQFGVATTGTATSKYLTGVYADTSAPVGSYVLQNQRGRVGFYQVQEGTQPMVRANRAYLTVPASANVKAFYMDDATAIQTVEELLSGKAEIYDLSGRRQQKLQKGINIVGGKKVLVK